MSNSLWTHGFPEGALTAFEEKLYSEWVDVDHHRTYNNKTTVCIIKLRNGFEITGTSGCEDPAKFDAKLGYIYALKDALKKLGEFAAFHRAEKARWAKDFAEGMATAQAQPLLSVPSPFEAEELKRHLKKAMGEALREYHYAVRLGRI